MSYQLVILQGNLTRDAEVRQVGQNTVASFSVATSRRYKKSDGTTSEETEYHDIELWNNGGVHPYLTKGASVLVQGEIKTDKWQDQQGQTRERKKIRASLIQLCGGRPQQQTVAPAAPQYTVPQPPVAPSYAPQPTQAPAYPTPPQYGAPQPPQAPIPPQPGQPGNQQYPPMNSPAYSQPQVDDMPL